MLQSMNYIAACDLICMGGQMEGELYVVPAQDGRYGVSTTSKQKLVPLHQIKEFKKLAKADAQKKGIDPDDAQLMVRVERIDHLNPNRIRITGFYRRNGVRIWRNSAVYRPLQSLRLED